MKRVILLTGANGFLGTQIARRLLESEDKIIALVRAKDEKEAFNRLSRAWWDWIELKENIGERVEVMRGDITKEKLDLEDGSYKEIKGEVTHLIHTAADLRLNPSLDDLRKTNVQGTLKILELAQSAHKDHGIERFSHISTAYVAGGRKGRISEDSLSDEYGFLNNYERSKFEAEIQVNNSELPLSIFRPGMIVGDSQTGAIKTFNTVYFFLRLYLNSQLKVLPVKPSLKINLVPVDYVADSVMELTFNPNAEHQTFHLTAPYHALPTVKEVVEFVRCWARENLNLRLPYTLFIPISPFLFQKFYHIGKMFHQSRLLETVTTLAPYFSEDREFLRSNTDKLLGPYPLSWQDYLSNLLKFAVYMGFFHRSERTVHEQILFRLKSRSRPVKYYDMMDERLIERSSWELRKDITAVAKSLKSLGVKPGERVALVGFNSTRYLTLDVALGLVGAISVPIYYTSPIDEINQILKSSGSAALFVGIPHLLDNLDHLKPQIPVISFCRESLDLPANFMTWNEFLELGINEDYLKDAPVNFDDIATIRYTSGTTGRPRGVIFTHENLRWMAESMASLPPWKDRNSEVSYLSFLPMNHVVEGILGTYSPYYAPAPLKLYFLEDFLNLQKMLPLAMPKIFFSVPRFYEKLWSAMKETWIGQRYLNAPDGLWKDILRKLVRREVLRRSGLDRCAQLIVGSASVSEKLLKDYQELGIEVHNAYGLSEAPLVTLNRLGRNKIGTVGEPLPFTKIKIADDGEVLVKGPQVTVGYFQEDSDILSENGWLLTGDLGHVTPEGSLVIEGRKKEVIINSYGKTINPLKIETMLKDIPGVAEAMVVGDGRPYCISLLWAEEEVTKKTVDTAIQDLNQGLSHPEQIKRWALLKNDLSIEKGDLTANLKLKRNEVSKHYQDVIITLYGNGTLPPGVLHKGFMERES